MTDGHIWRNGLQSRPEAIEISHLPAAYPAFRGFMEDQTPCSRLVMTLGDTFVSQLRHRSPYRLQRRQHHPWSRWDAVQGSRI
ncbi:hypothetical protein [Rhizobium leguminosarum]|uniref:hypothetical protein n=1 Tax=Rhizobium leguminosarum TaxID=384 RepID=UPI001C968523|nr:hypothetical protein [Rhizobium leguminosarum]MBY5378952.1 hypothetical protein [Rhizobium leguminosarum]